MQLIAFSHDFMLHIGIKRLYNILFLVALALLIVNADEITENKYDD